MLLSVKVGFVASFADSIIIIELSSDSFGTIVDDRTFIKFENFGSYKDCWISSFEATIDKSSLNICSSFETIKDMTNKMIKEGLAEEFAMTAAFCAIKEGYNAESFSLKYQEIKELSVKMKSEFRLEQKECFLAAIFAVNRGISIVNFGKSLNTIKSVIQTARGLGNFSLRNGGKFWMGMRQLANSLFPNLGKTVGMTIVRNGFVVLTAGLAIYDIISTSESWKNNHPTGAAIEDAILIMKEEINNFEALIDFLEKELQ